MSPEEKYKNFMSRALALARKGEGWTSPNPMVGAVIVKNGRVVGEGWHQKSGLPHGEIVALRKAGALARGADLFINLEPCCHFGKTPPCTDAIIAGGIKKVIIGMRDPNKKVYGKGIRQLRKHGITVVSGVLRNECEQLNEVFDKFIQTRRPFVILKTAMSLDGKIATPSGESKWITGPQARSMVHKIRHRVDAILTGAGTILKDDPWLTTRLQKGRGKNPIRVILDNKHQIPLTARVFKNIATDRVIYVAGSPLPPSRDKVLARRGVETLIMKGKKGEVDFKSLMKKLGEMDISSVLIEAGPQINASAIKDRVVDKIVVFLAPLIIGGQKAPGVVAGAGIKKLRDSYKVKNLIVTSIGNDFMLEGIL